MTTIAFIGLGTMGSRMARNLLKAGHEVRGFDLDPASVSVFAAEGARRAATMLKAADGADLVVTMLPNGKNGVLNHLPGGGVKAESDDLRGDRFVSMVEHMVEPSGVVRRLEVITGAGGRRRWSAAEKARITEEAMALGAVVSEIARRHGMSPQHLFTWRRAARRVGGSPAPMFVPAVIEMPVEALASQPRPRSRRRSSSSGIELEIDGVAVRVGPDASPRAIAAVIRALKAGS